MKGLGGKTTARPFSASNLQSTHLATPNMPHIQLINHHPAFLQLSFGVLLKSLTPATFTAAEKAKLVATLRRSYPGALYTVYGMEEEDEGVAAWVSRSRPPAAGGERWRILALGARARAPACASNGTAERERAGYEPLALDMPIACLAYSLPAPYTADQLRAEPPAPAAQRRCEPLSPRSPPPRLLGFAPSC